MGRSNPPLLSNPTARPETLVCGRSRFGGLEISAYLEGVRTGTVFADGQQIELGGPVSNGTIEQARYFLDCVKNDRPISLPAANLDEAVKTMELADAVLAGLRS